MPSRFEIHFLTIKSLKMVQYIPIFSLYLRLLRNPWDCGRWSRKHIASGH